MNLMAVDGERVALDDLVVMLREVQPLAVTNGFLHYGTALAEIENGFWPDVAFLDIELRDTSGIVLAQRLQQLLPRINLIFITGSGVYPYMSDAFALHASGYLKKPVSKERLREELKNLRYKPSRRGKPNKEGKPPNPSLIGGVF